MRAHFPEQRLVIEPKVYAAPQGMVFAPFCSENGYRFWFGIGYGFRGNYESV